MDRRSERETERGFLIAVIALLIAMAFIGFALYILPNLLWDWHYDVPEFVADWVYNFQNQFGLTQAGAGLLFFSIFFIPGLISGIIVYFIFSRIERLKLSETAPESSKKLSSNESWKESLGLMGQLLLLALLIFIIMRVLDWLIASPPP